MRVHTMALVAAVLLGCSSEPDGTPTGPTLSTDPPPTNPPPTYPSTVTIPGGGAAWIWGMVVNEWGGCMQGGTVRIVRGQGEGISVEQETPCAWWDYGGGFFISGLTPGDPMTLRATAPGYGGEEVTVIPHGGWQYALRINLPKK